MYELYYNTGGHGGPYKTLEYACLQAVDTIKGSQSITAIEIRPYDSVYRGGYGDWHSDSRYVQVIDGGIKVELI
jgi:hypothetical protein